MRTEKASYRATDRAPPSWDGPSMLSGSGGCLKSDKHNRGKKTSLQSEVNLSAGFKQPYSLKAVKKQSHRSVQ